MVTPSAALVTVNLAVVVCAPTVKGIEPQLATLTVIPAPAVTFACAAAIIASLIPSASTSASAISTVPKACVVSLANSSLKLCNSVLSTKILKDLLALPIFTVNLCSPVTASAGME